MRVATDWTRPAESRGSTFSRDRADLVAVEAVENAPGLLRVHESLVERQRPGDGLGHRLLGDLVEQHALDVGVRGAHLVRQVPGDGLPLAILVRREVQLVGVLDQGPELADLLLAVRAHDIERLEVVLGVDAEARPGLGLVLLRHVGGVAGQVADVTDRRLNGVPLAEVTADRLGLSR